MVRSNEILGSVAGSTNGPAPSLGDGLFARMRGCGADVLEFLHDGCPVVCVADATFAYVNAFKAHLNVGFFQGAALSDPAGLLEGAGKFMRHVKVKPGAVLDTQALEALIRASYRDIRAKLAKPEGRVPDS